MSLSNYAETELLDHLLGTATMTAPSAVYAALHDGDPGETGANEAEGGSYARQEVTFGAASNGAASNSAEVEFAGLAAGTYTHLSLWDASTSGNCLFIAALGSNKTVGAGDSIVFPIGDIDASLD